MTDLTALPVLVDSWANVGSQAVGTTWCVRGLRVTTPTRQIYPANHHNPPLHMEESPQEPALQEEDNTWSSIELGRGSGEMEGAEEEMGVQRNKMKSHTCGDTL